MKTERNGVKNLLNSSMAGILIPFVALFVALSIASPVFFTVNNLMTLLRQATINIIIAFGMTFVIAVGGIDLSVGSVLAMSGMFAAAMILKGMNIYLAVLIALIFGALVGCVNGLMIALLDMPDFIATMITMTIGRGVVYIFSKGIPIYGLRFPEFQNIAQAYWFGVPVPVFIALLFGIISFYLLFRTAFGRHVLSVGSNVDAARYVGIHVEKIKIICYTICGLLAAVAGIVLTSRLEAATPEAGNGFELDAIAATVIGGNSLSGGKASIVGTTIGAILMAMVANGLNLLNISTYWHQVVMGMIIFVAVAVDRINEKRKQKS